MRPLDMGVPMPAFLSETKGVAIMPEPGFHDLSEDRKFLIGNNAARVYAAAVLTALTRYSMETQ